MRFFAPRVSFPVRLFVGNAARSEHSWSVFFQPRPGSEASYSRSLAGNFCSFPATLMGFSYPSQLCSARRVSAPFGVSRPHAVLPCARREFHRRGTDQSLVAPWTFGSGFWGLAPSGSRAVLFAGPAIAFARRADPIQPAVAALDFNSSLRSLPPASGRHFWGHSARAFRRA